MHLSRCSLWPTVLTVAAALFVPLAAQEKKDPGDPFRHLKYRSIGPAAGGRVSRAVRRARRPAHLLRRHRLRRRLEVDRRRPHAGSRSSTTSRSSSIGSHRRRAVRPERRLRRHRRGEHPRQRRGRQRHLQVDRRRQDLEARLEAGRPDRHDGRPPDEPRHRLRRRARPRLRPQPGARRLPHHRRRQDLAAGARQGRRHRRQRRLLRPEQPAHPLRRPVAGAAAGRGR